MIFSCRADEDSISSDDVVRRIAEGQAEYEDLWLNHRTLLRAVGGETSEDQATGVVEQCVAEFAKIDPAWDAFRYPTRRRGQPFGTELKMLDLVSLRDTMQGLESYFLAVDCFLYSLTEIRSLAPEVESS